MFMQKKIKDLLFPMTGGHLSELIRATLFYCPIVGPGLFILFTGFDHIWIKWSRGFIISLTCSYTCILFSALMQVLEANTCRLFGWKDFEYTKRWGLGMAILAMPLGMYFGFHLCERIEGISFNINFDDYRVGFLIGTAIALAFFILEAWRETRVRNRENEARMKDLENERLQAQISALTAQMNPHLMFNALNTVAALVPTDPAKAEEVVIKLSELYRGVLDSSRKMTHSLATELRLCDAYLSVERARFGDRLKARIEIADSVNPATTEIPALSIQPLLENAIKHGLAPKAAGGEVAILAAADNGTLKIEIHDNGVGLNSAAVSPLKKGGAGTGLKNTRDRLKLHYGEGGAFKIYEREQGGTAIQMSLPLKTFQEVTT